MSTYDDENARRTERYRKGADLEAALDALNRRLETLAPPPPALKGPVLLVVGPPRGGTTLLAQLIARAVVVTIPDNVVARFWRAPEIGVLISRSLRSQIQIFEGSPQSEYGVTQGPFDVHEFGYFWQRFFDFSQGHALSEAALASVPWAALRDSLARMQEAGGGHPLSMKGVALSQILGPVAHHIPELVVVRIHRDPRFVAQSMMRARRERYADTTAWWSVEPEDHVRLRTLPALEQVVGQLAGILRGIDLGLANVPPERQVHIDYEALCADPEGTLAPVAASVGSVGSAQLAVRGPVFATPPARRIVDPATFEALEAELSRQGLASPSTRSIPSSDLSASVSKSK